VTTSMTNDFLLKTMEINSATIDLKEFTYGILSGFMERLFLPTGATVATDLVAQMKIRADGANKGDGPKR